MVPLIPLSSLQTAPAKHGTPAFDFLRIRAFWAISSRHLRAPRCSNLSRMVKKRDENVLVSLLSFPTRPPAQQKMKNSLDATFRFDFYPKIRAYTGTLFKGGYQTCTWSWIARPIPDLEFFVEFFRYATLVKVIERFHVVSVELQYNLALHVLNSVSVSMTFSSHRTQLYK